MIREMAPLVDEGVADLGVISESLGTVNTNLMNLFALSESNQAALLESLEGVQTGVTGLLYVAGEMLDSSADNLVALEGIGGSISSNGAVLGAIDASVVANGVLLSANGDTLENIETYTYASGLELAGIVEGIDELQGINEGIASAIASAEAAMSNSQYEIAEDLHVIATATGESAQDLAAIVAAQITGNADLASIESFMSPIYAALEEIEEACRAVETNTDGGASGYCCTCDHAAIEALLGDSNDFLFDIEHHTRWSWLTLEHIGDEVDAQGQEQAIAWNTLLDIEDLIEAAGSNVAAVASACGDLVSSIGSTMGVDVSALADNLVLLEQDSTDIQQFLSDETSGSDPTFAPEDYTEDSETTTMITEIGNQMDDFDIGYDEVTAALDPGAVEAPLLLPGVADVFDLAAKIPELGTNSDWSLTLDVSACEAYFGVSVIDLDLDLSDNPVVPWVRLMALAFMGIGTMYAAVRIIRSAIA